MLQRPLPRPAYFLLCALLIVAATFVTLQIAITTAFDTHPDEVNHADGFCFYETHWWPPPLNADNLRYSPYGMSRLHEEEIVYILFGKIAAILRPVVEPWFAAESAPGVDGQSQLFLPAVKAPDFCFVANHTYRLLNVLLLIGTLVILFWMGLRYRWATSLALLILAIPQAVYIHGYANSDAWALLIGTLLLLTALVYHDRARLNWRDALWFGLLTGLMLLSKRTFWLSIPLSYLILAHKGYRLWHTDRAALNSLLWGWLPLVLALTFLLILPLKIVYPLSQGDYAAGVFEMRETRAREDLRPSNPTYPGYLMAEDGYPYSVVWADPSWWKASYQSFYGVFGYWAMYASKWAYIGAGNLLLLGTGLTLLDFVRRRAAYSTFTRLMLIATPLAIVAMVVASTLYSWLFDFQPQGRYLLPALLPLAFLVGGAVDDEPRWLRAARGLIWALLLALSFYTLWTLISVGLAPRG